MKKGIHVNEIRKLSIQNRKGNSCNKNLGELSILDVHGRSRVLGEESDFVLILASSRSFSFTDLGEPSSLRDRFDLDSLRLLSVEDLEDEEFEELLRRLLLGLRP